MKRITTLILGLLLSSGAMAATFNVGVGQTYTDLDSAITAANTTPGSDTLVLFDATYVLAGSPNLVTEELTIQTNGQAVLISKSSASGQVLRPTMATGKLRIQGASPANPITLLQNTNNSPCINSGPTTTNTNTLELVNVVLEKPASGAGSGSNFSNINNSSTGSLFDHVVFKGGDPTSTAPVALFGNAFSSIVGVTLTNVDFSQAAPAAARISHYGVALTATNCNITRAAGDSLGVSQSGGPVGSTLTFTNCTFRSGALSLIDAPTVAATYTLVTPTCGLIGTSTGKLANNTSGSTVTVSGTYTLVGDPLTDTDADGMSDLWEVVGQLNPNSSATPNGPGDDPDSDGKTNLAEFQAGTNPRDASSGGSGPVTPVAGYTALACLTGALAFAARKRLVRA